MNGVLLLAFDIGDVFGLVLGILFVIFAVFGQLITKWQEKQKGPQRPGGPRPGAAPKRKPLEDEIGQFLRDAVKGRGGRQQQASRPAAPPASKPGGPSELFRRNNRLTWRSWSRTGVVSASSSVPKNLPASVPHLASRWPRRTIKCPATFTRRSTTN